MTQYRGDIKRTTMTEFWKKKYLNLLKEKQVIDKPVPKNIDDVWKKRYLTLLEEKKVIDKPLPKQTYKDINVRDSRNYLFESEVHWF